MPHWVVAGCRGSSSCVKAARASSDTAAQFWSYKIKSYDVYESIGWKLRQPFVCRLMHSRSWHLSPSSTTLICTFQAHTFHASGMCPESRRARKMTTRSISVENGCHSSKITTPRENRSTCSRDHGTCMPRHSSKRPKNWRRLKTKKNQDSMPTCPLWAVLIRQRGKCTSLPSVFCPPIYEF